MSFNLILVKQSAYQGRTSHEILEAIMSLGLFDIEHKVVFFENGIDWLLTDQKPQNQKSLEKQIAALPMYGSENLHFCQEHQQKIFPDQTINSEVEPVPLRQVAAWFNQAKHTEVF